MRVPVGQKKYSVIPDPDRAKYPHGDLQVMRGKSRYISIVISQMTMTRNFALIKKYSVISHNVLRCVPDN